MADLRRSNRWRNLPLSFTLDQRRAIRSTERFDSLSRGAP